MILRNISGTTWAFRVLSRLTYVCLTAFLIACDASNEKRDEGSSDLNQLVAVRTSFPDPGEWSLHGRTYDEQRYSPINQIHTDNIDQLALAWSYDTGDNRKHESTPIVVDGVMYVTASWSVVHALNAKSGEKLWVFDPEVPKDLRYADNNTHLNWNAIVIGGARASRGMAAFGDVLTPEDAEAIRSYVVSQAYATLEAP